MCRKTKLLMLEEIKKWLRKNIFAAWKRWLAAKMRIFADNTKYLLPKKLRWNKNDFCWQEESFLLLKMYYFWCQKKSFCWHREIFLILSPKWYMGKYLDLIYWSSAIGRKIVMHPRAVLSLICRHIESFSEVLKMQRFFPCNMSFL